MGRRKPRRETEPTPRKGMRRSIRRDALSPDAPRRADPGPKPPEVHLRLMRAEEALAKLEMMVELHRRQGTPELLVVHGKGLHSEGGEPVIAPLARRWCDEHRESVASWSEAPRGWGGPGAIVLRLRRD